MNQDTDNSTYQRLKFGWIQRNGEWVAKPCSCCLKVLPLSEFYQRKGHTPMANCKRCHIRIQAEREKGRYPIYSLRTSKMRLTLHKDNPCPLNGVPASEELERLYCLNCNLPDCVNGSVN